MQGDLAAIWNEVRGQGKVLEAELARRQTSELYTSKAFEDIRDAIDKQGDAIQENRNRIHDDRVAIQAINTRLEEDSRTDLRIFEELQRVHDRISTLRRDTKTDLAASETRTHEFLKTYGPYLVMGILATAGFFATR